MHAGMLSLPQQYSILHVCLPCCRCAPVFTHSTLSQAPEPPIPRPQVDREEVRLRRTISIKKDEYHLDRKQITWVARPGGAHFSSSIVCMWQPRMMR